MYISGIYPIHEDTFTLTDFKWTEWNGWWTYSEPIAHFASKFMLNILYNRTLCLMGRARSQQLKALETSVGVQMEMWLQLTSFSSKMYVKPRTWFSSSLRRVSNVITWALMRSLTLYLLESKAAAWEKITRRPCWSRSGRTKMYPASTSSDNAESWNLNQILSWPWEVLTVGLSMLDKHNNWHGLGYILIKISLSMWIWMYQSNTRIRDLNNWRQRLDPCWMFLGFELLIKSRK